MSELKPTATPFTPSTSKSWAEDDDSGGEDGDLREEFGMPSPGKAAADSEGVKDEGRKDDSNGELCVCVCLSVFALGPEVDQTFIIVVSFSLYLL
jgi:hypothetical protein